MPEFRKGAKIRMDCWPKGQYICLKDGDIVDEDELNRISNWFFNGNWELYQEPIDWDYIIKNKCLCLFWDEGKERQVRNFLKDVRNPNCKHPLFYDPNGINWDCCRPVRRDEVTFYEDKKDEN